MTRVPMMPLFPLLQMLLSDPAQATTRRGAAPAWRSRRTADGFAVEVEAAGYAPEQLCVEVEPGSLSLQATPSEESALRPWSLRLELPEGIDAEAIAASCRHGLLQIELPLAKKPEPRRIPLEAA